MERSNIRGVVRNRFEDLEPEIISDILSRLPIEWILICKCLCKAWRTLIKDDNFVKLQLHRSNNIPTSHVILESCLDAYRFKSGKINRFLVDIQDPSTKLTRLIPRVPLADILTNKNLKITCSLNGLICLVPEVCKTDPVVVCNPIIRGDSIILPESEHDYWSHNITLGFDNLINKYKAVKVLIYYDGSILVPNNRRCFFEVITIGEETSWRRVSIMEKELHFRVPRGGVFHQGSIYWIIDRCTPFPHRESDNPNGYYILEFDVSKEVSRVISFPYYMKRPSFECFENIRRFSYRQATEAILDVRLQIMGGSLVLMQNDHQLLHIWQIVRGRNLDDRVVEYRSIRISLPSKIPHARIIALLHSNNVVDDDFLLLERPPGRWMTPEKRVNHKKRRETEFFYYFPYSSSSKKSDRFRILSGLEIESHENFLAWCFKPSLVSVKKDLLGQH